jgi:hypothetical protein
MKDKHARKLDKLLQDHREARRTRKTACAARGVVKGVQGRGGRLAALASSAGTKAVEAELAALKAERRALKKLHAFAVKTVGRAAVSSKTPAPVATTTGAAGRNAARTAKASDAGQQDSGSK